MATSKEIKENLRGLNLLKVVLTSVLNDTDIKKLKRKATVQDMTNILLEAVEKSSEYTKKVYSDKYPNSYNIEFGENGEFTPNRMVDYNSEYNPIMDNSSEDLNVIKNRLLNNLYSIDNHNLYSIWFHSHTNDKNEIDGLKIIYIYVNEVKQICLTNDVFHKTSNGTNSFHSKTYTVKNEDVKDALNSLIINNAGVNANDSKLLNSNAGEFIFNINKEIIDENISGETTIYSPFNSALVFYPNDNFDKIDHLVKMIED